MDHPLRSEENLPLRRDIYQLFKNGYSIPKQSNIVFVCGGTEPHHMRKRFQADFGELLPGYQFFEPEFAMRTYWTLGDDKPFDIATFEELVGELSHSIIIFPEAPGSLAETGYFSAKPELAQKILLAINNQHLAKDSFISIGPAKKIADVSLFQPNIEMDYDHPDFARVAQRILDRAPLHTNRRALEIKPFADMQSFELFAIIQCFVSLLGIATVEDIEYFLKGLFSGTIRPSKVKQIISILVGSGRLVGVGEFGHLRVVAEQGLILQIKDGAKTTHDVLKVNMSTAYLGADPDFIVLLGDQDAA